jgi:hypothetical protein
MSLEEMQKTSDLILKALSKAHSTRNSDRRRACSCIKDILASPDRAIPEVHIDDLFRVLTELLYDDDNDTAGFCVAGLGHLVSNESFPTQSEEFIIDILCNIPSSRPGLNMELVMSALNKIGSKKTLSVKKVEGLYSAFLGFASDTNAKVRLHAVTYLGMLCARQDFSHKTLEVLDVLMQQAVSDSDQKVRDSAICSLGAFSIKSNIPDDRLDAIIEFCLQPRDYKARLYALAALVEGTKSQFPTARVMQVYQHAREVFETSSQYDVHTEALALISRLWGLETFAEDQLEDVAQRMILVNAQHDEKTVRATALSGLSKMTRSKKFPPGLIAQTLTLGLVKSQAKTENTSSSGLHIICHLISNKRIPAERINAVVRVLRMFDDPKCTEPNRCYLISGFTDLVATKCIQKEETQDMVLDMFLRVMKTSSSAKVKNYALGGIGNVVEHAIGAVRRNLSHVDVISSYFTECMEQEIDDSRQDQYNKAISVRSMGNLIKRDLLPLKKQTLVLLRLILVHATASSTNVGLASIYAVTGWAGTTHFPYDGVVSTCRKLLRHLSTRFLKFRVMDCLAALVVNQDLKTKDPELACDLMVAVKQIYEKREEFFKDDGDPLPEERQTEVTASMEALLAKL